MEEKLIEAVQKKKSLYDTLHKDYMKIKLKNRIWEDIAKEIGMNSGAEAKTTWEKLRHAYRDALRRQKRLITEQNVHPSRQKPWKYQQQMEFLQSYMISARKGIVIKEESYDNYSSEDLTAETGGVQEGGIFEEPDCKVEILDNDWEEQDNSTSNVRENSPALEKDMRKRANIAHLLKQSMDSRAKRAADRAIERSVLIERMERTSDPLYHFFMSMYETTKKMPVDSQHHIKNQIFKTVTEMEAVLLNISSTELPDHFQPQ